MKGGNFIEGSVPVWAGTESGWRLGLRLRVAGLLPLSPVTPTHPIGDRRAGDGLPSGAHLSQSSFDSRRGERAQI